MIMRRIILTAILILVMVILAACGAEEEAYEEYNEEFYEEEVEEAEEEPAEEIAAQPFLDDLDYMLYVLENNFALFDVAYWARGVDIRAIVEDIRAEIRQNPDMDVDEFYRLLTWNFIPMRGIGHFAFVGVSEHYEIITGRQVWQSWFFTPVANARLREPHVMAFYEPRHNRPLMLHNLPDNWAANEGMLDRMVDALIRRGEYGSSEMLVSAWAVGDAVRVYRLSHRLWGTLATGPNVTTRSIEEGRIAHLTVNSFWWMNYPGSAHDNQILDFFEDIRGYEHLIIDLRYTGGGSASNFVLSMMAPNIEESVRVEGYVFLTHGEYAAGYYTRVLSGSSLGPRQFRARMYSVDRRLRSIDEMLQEFYLPEFNMTDAARLDYGFRMHMDVPARHLTRFDYQPAFDGKIWFLTGPRMGSAVQISSWVAKESGFATLVGEVTGGVYGGPRTFVTLPNSGIAFAMDLFYVTDQHGRPLEAGTVPHYFNRPGMDALQTVLAKIEEMDESGNY